MDTKKPSFISPIDQYAPAGYGLFHSLVAYWIRTIVYNHNVKICDVTH